jgi:MFS family permease
VPEASRVRSAWWATLLYFLLHGLIVGTWVSRIPGVQSNLHLSNGVLGVTLLSSAIGAMVCIPVTGFLLTRFGNRRVTGGATAFFAMSLVLPGLAFNAPSLGLALFFFGGLASAMDVSMNAHGVEVENLLGKPTMSRFHGMFSLGAMISAAIGGLTASRGVTPLALFVVSATLYASIAFCIWPLLLKSRPAAHGMKEHRLPISKIPKVLWALSAIGFCILLSEGAMADWTAVYLKQALSSGPGQAAAGYSGFSAAMAIFRFLGDWITARLGAFRTVLWGSLVGAVGLLWSLAVHSPALALPGFAAVGIGFSVIIPLVFGSGGRVPGIHPGAGIATVTGIGYVGFIVGPPTIGFAAQLFTLRYGLGVVVVCCLISAVLSPAIQGLSAGGKQPDVVEPV